MCFLLYGLKQPPFTLTLLYCDNQREIHISVNLVFHECTKHLGIGCHLVREKVQVGVCICYIFLHKIRHQMFSTKQLGPIIFIIELSSLG